MGPRTDEQRAYEQSYEEALLRLRDNHMSEFQTLLDDELSDFDTSGTRCTQADAATAAAKIAAYDQGERVEWCFIHGSEAGDDWQIESEWGVSTDKGHGVHDFQSVRIVREIGAGQ